MNEVEGRTVILEGASQPYHEPQAESEASGAAGKNLVAEMGRLMHAFHRAFHEMAGLSTAQWRIIALLAREEQLTEQDIESKIGAKIEQEAGKFKPLSQRKIQELLGVDAAGITRVAKQLEQDGMIRRETDPRDNRFTLIYLSDAGRRFYDDIEQKVELLWQQAFVGIEPDDVGRMRTTIHQLADNLSACADAAEK